MKTETQGENKIILADEKNREKVFKKTHKTTHTDSTSLSGTSDAHEEILQMKKVTDLIHSAKKETKY